MKKKIKSFLMDDVKIYLMLLCVVLGILLINEFIKLQKRDRQIRVLNNEVEKLDIKANRAEIMEDWCWDYQNEKKINSEISGISVPQNSETEKNK